MKVEKMNGYITTTNKYHYIMLTGKRRLTAFMVCEFVRKIASKQNIPQNKLDKVLQSRESMQAMRKKISPCYYDQSGDYIKIFIGKSELHYTKEEAEKSIITFYESDKHEFEVAEILREEAL